MWFHLEKPQKFQQSTLDILSKKKSFKILLSTKKKTKNFNVLLPIREENKILSNEIYYHSPQ